jgi:hypothetical protein
MIQKAGQVWKEKKTMPTLLEGHNSNLQLIDSRKIEVISKCGDAVQFAIRFNPEFQLKLRSIRADYTECYKFDYPTFSMVGIAYGSELAIGWLANYFDNLNDFVGVKEKLTTAQINELSSMIYFEFYYLKISEIALFFSKYKSGRFGEFYGVVDPLKIMTALNEFISERKQSIDIIKRNLENEELDRKREEWAKTAITREEHLRLKRIRVFNIKKIRKRKWKNKNLPIYKSE